jgi:putative ABC transport system permease protein
LRRGQFFDEHDVATNPRVVIIDERFAREIGIRMALGATQLDILSLVVRQGMSLALLGVAIGLAGTFALTRLMRSPLFGVSASDPFTFVAISPLLAFIALLASYISARRAARIAP